MTVTRLYMSSLFQMPELVEDAMTPRIMDQLRTRNITRLPSHASEFIQEGDKVVLDNSAYISQIQSGKLSIRDAKRIYTVIKKAGNIFIDIGHPHEEKTINIALRDIRLATQHELYNGQPELDSSIILNPNLIYLMNRCTNHALRMDLATISTVSKGNRNTQLLYVQALYYEQVHKPAEKICQWIDEISKREEFYYPESARVAALLEYLVMCFLLNARTFKDSPSTLEFTCISECEILEEYVAALMLSMKDRMDQYEDENQIGFFILDDMFTMEQELLALDNKLPVECNRLKQTKYHKMMPTQNPVTLHRPLDNYHFTEITLVTINTALLVLPELIGHLATI